METKPNVEEGLYKCNGCKKIKLIKPAYNKQWSKKQASHSYRVIYRCKDCTRNTIKKWRKNNYIKYKAHAAVFISLRNGFIKKEPCEICGSLKVEAHHVDYEKPLDVIWYCKEHHVMADRLERLKHFL